MSSMKRYVFLAMLSVVAVVAFNMVQVARQSPEEADRMEIAKCWEESKGATLTSEKQKIVIGACQALEKVFQLNYGAKKLPYASAV